MIAYRDAFLQRSGPSSNNDPLADMTYVWPAVASSAACQGELERIHFGLVYDPSDRCPYLIKESLMRQPDSTQPATIKSDEVGRYQDLTTAIRIAHEQYLLQYYAVKRDQLIDQKRQVLRKAETELAEISRKQAFLLKEKQLPAMLT